MRAIGKQPGEVMNLLTEGLAGVGDHKKIDNAPGQFMAVSVECIGEIKLGLIFSVAHYYEQNGDLMRDPEMTFLKGIDGKYYPASFQQDNMGFYQESIIFDDELKYKAQMQAEHASFAEMWMDNIRGQQRL